MGWPMQIPYGPEAGYAWAQAGMVCGMGKSLRPAQVELAELKIEIILIGENWHRSTLNPVIFSLAEHQTEHLLIILI